MRALEFLLGGVRTGERVLTVGGEGSTHVLATAAHAARLGVRTEAIRWPHDMSPVAHVVAEEAGRRSGQVLRVDGAAGALRAMVRVVRAWLLRSPGAPRWIPLGGTCALGALGHVNAGLELAEQVAAGAMPRPERVVVPLGTGGTSAGLALGFAIAGLETTVVGVRVGPRVGANRRRALAVARATARLITRRTGERVAPPRRDALIVVHDQYGGAYGRPARAGAEAAEALRRATGLRLELTYSAKAFAAALAIARAEPGVTLFWLTFDGRWMAAEAGGSGRGAADADGEETMAAGGEG